MTTDDVKLEILHDHYKDSFAHVREYIAVRDRLLFYILIVLTLILLQIFSPQDGGRKLSEFITSKLGLTSQISTAFIVSMIWFGLLALLIKYFQTVICIEGQYEYIHRLEDELSKHYKEEIFSREGKTYSKNYPIFSKWAHIIYRIIFPGLLVTIVLIKIAGEWLQPGNNGWLLGVNSLIVGSILITVYLYLKTVFRQ
jgi:hypothetical protein